jgi:rhamnulokinase
MTEISPVSFQSAADDQVERHVFTVSRIHPHLQMKIVDGGRRAAIDHQLKKHGGHPPRDLGGYIRIICESLGRGHAEAVRMFERLAKRQFARILIVGGGSKNRLLCQATANASGLPVASYSIEGTAVGDLASQLISLGAVKDLATFRHHLARNLKQTIYQPRS